MNTHAHTANTIVGGGGGDDELAMWTQRLQLSGNLILVGEHACDWFN